MMTGQDRGGGIHGRGVQERMQEGGHNRRLRTRGGLYKPHLNGMIKHRAHLFKV